MTALHYLFVLSIVGNFCLLFLYNSPFIVQRSLPAVRRSNIEQLDQNRKLTEADITIPRGARRVFIDLGANDGGSTSFFINPITSDTQDGGTATQGGDHKSFLKGLGSSRDWEVVVMEANINFTNSLVQLQKKAMSNHMVKNFTVHAGTAIAKTSGFVSFILDNAKAGAEGATTMAESTSAVGPHYKIPAIGIVDLFHGMRIHHGDFVVLKIDVEGFEFELLRHIITHGLHSRIDVLAVEFHDVNYWVFGKNEAISAKYQALHKCLDWMVEDIHSMKVVKWG